MTHRPAPFLLPFLCSTVLVAACAVPASDGAGDGGGGSSGSRLCVDDSDCGGGRCTNFVCIGGGAGGSGVGGSGAGGSGAGGSGAGGIEGCFRDSDCALDEWCDRGACVPLACGAGGCGACFEDPDCPRGSHCSAGACVACEPQSCELGCAAGFALDAQGCELCECASCTSDQQCPSPPGLGCSGICVDGSCQVTCDGSCSGAGSCGGAELCLAGSCRSCDCSREYAPVCGEDRVTYVNFCYLECAGVVPVMPGSCDVACDCPASDQPVCGWDYVTHPNPCDAECFSEGVQYVGPCQAP